MFRRSVTAASAAAIAFTLTPASGASAMSGTTGASGSGSVPGSAAAAPQLTTAKIGAKSCNKINESPKPANAKGALKGGPLKIGREYVRTFYPRWFTYYQAEISPCNKLLGPRRVTPRYRSVVAINNDTIYTSSTVDVSKEPVVVTVPAASTIFSVLQLDGYGNVLGGIPSNTPGTYALTGPNWSGSLPKSLTEVKMPYDTTILIFRADKYAVDGTDKRAEAYSFRKSLRLASLTDYKSNADNGAPRIVPSAAFGGPFKIVADRMLKSTPKKFLKQTKTALRARTTQPMSKKEARLSNRFNRLYAKKSNRVKLSVGARRAHKQIVNNYLNGTLPGSQWVHFSNMGEWKSNRKGYLDRSSISEYIQFGNNLTAASYFQTFNDGKGRMLDGKYVYKLRFKKSQLPSVDRFWSLTAYTPKTIELVRNKAKKYLVASYTPKLRTSKSGAVTITMANKKPKGVPKANWLPIPKGQFNVMLRAYGPTGSVKADTYTPPAVKRR